MTPICSLPLVTPPFLLLLLFPSSLHPLVTLNFSLLFLHSLIPCSIVLVYLSFIHPSIYHSIYLSIYGYLSAFNNTICLPPILSPIQSFFFFFALPFSKLFLFLSTSLSNSTYLPSLLPFDTLSPCPLIQSSLHYLPSPSSFSSLVHKLYASPPIFCYFSVFPSQFISITVPLVLLI